MNNIISKLLIITLLLFCGNSISFAQVTIGSEKPPISGALLDLKEFNINDPQSNGETTATKGLALPRVQLQSVDGDLATSMGLAAGTLDKNNHVGLTIYNVVSDQCSTILQGIYTWNGNVWQYLGGSSRKDQTSFNPATEILTDYEGNEYTTKIFGTKRWMTQNLRSIRKADGNCIDGVNGMRFNPAKNATDMPVAQIAVKSAVPSGNVTFQQNGATVNLTNDALVSIYGLVYTFPQANDACPAGWHLSTEQDWTDLITTLGGATNIGAKIRGNTGTIYKTIDATSYTWGMSDPAVIISGFNALPSGWVRDNGITAAAFGNSIYW